MKKNILFLLLYFSFVFIPVANAENIAKIKDINVTELDNNIVFDVKSTKEVPYNVVNYANGDVGVKFVDASLDSNVNEDGKLQINQSEDIDGASVNTDNKGNVEVVFSGSDNLTKKKINVNTEIANNSIILIEPEPEVIDSDFLPLSLQATSLPPLDDYEMVAPEKPVKTVKAKTPPAISLQALNDNKLNEENLSKGKRLLAQASPVEDEEVIEFGSDSSTVPSSESLETETSTTSTSDVASDEEKKGFFSSIFDWIKSNVFLSIVIGIAILIVGFVLLVIILAMIGSKMQVPDGTMPMPTPGQADEGAGPSVCGNIEDDEPVDFIPPSRDSGTQSVSDAINKVINMRNKID